MSLDPTSSVASLNNLSYLNQENEIKPIVIIASRAPTIRDRRYKKGTTWIDGPNDNAWLLTSVRGGQANWEPISQSAGGNAPLSIYVVAQDGSGDFTTVQAALDAANAAGGGTICLREGSYVENLTLHPNVHLWGVAGDSLTETVAVVGNHTLPSSGKISFKNLFFNRISGGIILNTPASSADITADHCKFSLVNGYSFFLTPGFTGNLEINDCLANSTDDGFLFAANNGNIRFKDSELGGLGLTNQLNINAVNSFSAYNCVINSRLILGVVTNPFEIDGGCIFKNTITGADPTFGSIRNSVLKPSSGAALAHLSSGTIQLIDSVVDTPNIPAISGGGTGILEFANLSFLQDSSIGSIIVSPKKSMSGSFEAGNRVNYLRMIDNKFEVDGSLANIDVEMFPKGTGSFALKNGDVAIEGLGNGLNIKEGANARMGVATLVAGTVIVSTTAVTANSRIILTNQSPGGTIGFLWISARIPGTSFTITSSSGADTSTVAWVLLEPA